MKPSGLTRITQLHELLLAKRGTRCMKYFDNDIKMELLFLIYLHQGDKTWGISDYVNAISTSPQSNSSLSLFIRNMLKASVFELQGSDKKTRKHLVFTPRTQKELEAMVLMHGTILDQFSRKKSTPLPASEKFYVA